MEIVVFTSCLGLGGSGLFGLEGALICWCKGDLFFKVFWLSGLVDSWVLTEVWIGFKGTFNFDFERFDGSGRFFLSSGFWSVWVLTGFF